MRTCTTEEKAISIIKNELIDMKMKHGYFPSTAMIRKQVLNYIYRHFDSYEECIIKLFGESEYHEKKRVEGKKHKGRARKSS